MSFGIDAGISRQTNNTVEVAQKETNAGVIDGMTTFGGKTEVTEESYSDAFTNEATNGQDSTSDIVTAHSYIENNKEYARESKTLLSALGAPA